MPCSLVKFTSVSEDCTAIILRVKHQAKQENALLLDLFFDPEGSNMFLQNISKLLPFKVTA
jgi:hypothetical protein